MNSKKLLGLIPIILIVFSGVPLADASQHPNPVSITNPLLNYTNDNFALHSSDRVISLQSTHASTDREILRFSSYTQRDQIKQELLQQGIKIFYEFQSVPALTVEITNVSLPEDVVVIPSIENVRQYSDSQVIYNNPLKPHVSTQVTTTEESARWIGVSYLWDHGYLGDGMELGIIDSGVNSNLKAFHDADDLNINRVTRVVVSELSSEGSQDLSGHGTHVASIAVGNGYYNYNGEYELFNSHGMAPKAKLYSVKVLNSYGSGADTGVIEGMDLAIARNVSVISMSLGSTDFQTPASNKFFGTLVKKATQKDILIVAAAGNAGLDGSSSVSLPAGFPNVLAVGAVIHELVNLQDRFYPWTFSATGPAIPPDSIPKPDILAPGVNIVGLNNTNGNLVVRSGTSMSVPHVSGGAILLRQAFPQASAQEIKAAILASATDLGYPVEVQGRGMVNFEKAYKILKNGEDLTVSANPIAIHDGNEVNQNYQYVRQQNLYYFSRIQGATKRFNVSLNSPVAMSVVPHVQYLSPKLDIELPASLNLTEGMNTFSVNITINSPILQQNKADIYFTVNATMLPYANISYFSQTIPSRGTVMFDRSKDHDTEVSYYINDGPHGKYSKYAQLLENNGYIVKENLQPLSTSLLSNIDVLVISDPDVEYSGKEILLLRDFVDDDGKGLIILGNGGFERTDEDSFASFSVDSLNTILSLSAREQTGIQFRKDGYSPYQLTERGFSVYTRRDQSVIDKNAGIDYFGPGLTVDGANTQILASNRGIPLAASSEVGKGRIVVFGSTITFDNYGLLKGRYKSSSPDEAQNIALQIVDWAIAPQQIQTSYIIEDIEYKGHVQATMNIRKNVRVEFTHPLLPSGEKIDLPAQIPAYLVHKDNPLLTLTFNFTYDPQRDAYFQILNIQIWGEYFLYTPIQINGYTPSDGRLDLFVDLPLYSDQANLKLMARILLVATFISWIIWLKNERKKK